MDFDAAVIGAGPEGLIAAIMLARAGLSTVLLEKGNEAGGRAATHEFHPGFKASLYADELAAISPRLYRTLDLARNGAIFAPSPASSCVTDAGTSMIFSDDARAARTVPPQSRAGFLRLRREIEIQQQEIEARAATVSIPRRAGFFRRVKEQPTARWLSRGSMSAALDEMLRARISDPLLRMHLASEAISGRAVSPFLAGTALNALAPGVGRSGQTAGGLGRFGAALVRIAASAGVTIRCNAEIAAIRVKGGRATALVSTAGEEIEARAYVSSLDLKRTFLNLIAWDALPAGVIKRARRFRIAGQAARVLVALDARPDLTALGEAADIVLGPIHVASSMEALSGAYDRWRAGALPESPLVTLRLPSFGDPRLAPAGKAVLTATVSCIPAQLFDGAWTEEKREQVTRLVLAAADRALPGVGNLKLAHQVLIGSDVENALGLTAGDLEGGELAPDQALGFRPFSDAEWSDGRTPIASLYLAGSSSAASPFLLGASGERAARAVIADFKGGR